jgi:hypothetical protein
VGPHLDKVKNELSAKGIDTKMIGGEWKEYWPQLVSFNRYERLGMQAVLDRKTWSQAMEQMVNTGVFSSLKRKFGGSIPSLAELRRITEMLYPVWRSR